MKNIKISLALILSSVSLIILWLPVSNYAGSTHCFGNNPIVDSGLTTCHDMAGAIITCPARDGVAPQDASYNPPNLQQSYTVDDTNLIVVDNRTGLMWKKCAQGLTTASCTGTISLMYWDAALTTCQTTFAGYSDWRLPNLPELTSLIYLGVTSAPYINPVFTGTPSSGRFWTNTQYTSAYPASAYTVRFDQGVQVGSAKATNYYVRCVRGGP